MVVVLQPLGTNASRTFAVPQKEAGSANDPCLLIALERIQVATAQLIYFGYPDP
jgi:hypothetical protein